MSKHNIYPQFTDRIVSRWQKTTIYPIAGKRLDPHDKNKQLDFILRTREENYNFETKQITVVYDDEVLELYSDDEQRLFLALNRAAVEAGLLKPYTETKRAVDETNILSDEQVTALATTANHLKFEAEIKKITSLITLRRIAQEIPDTRSLKFFRVVENRIKELS